MPPPKTHDEARYCVCTVCFRKQSVLRELSSEIVTQINVLLCDPRDPVFDPSETRFPLVICKSCQLALAAHTKVFEIFIKIKP